MQPVSAESFPADLQAHALLRLLRSARESPVAWEGDAVEGVESNPPSHPETHSSSGANQGHKRWEAEEEEAAKEEPPVREEEGSTSGVGGRGPSRGPRASAAWLVVSEKPAGV